MTDSRLRELERRWRTTGAVEDEARLLAARVRAGDLLERNVALAAYLDHTPSVMACNAAAPDALVPVRKRLDGLRQAARAGQIVAAEAVLHPSEAAEMLESLQEWGKCACLRALVALSRRLCQKESARLEELTEAAEAWLLPETCGPFDVAAFRLQSPGVVAVGVDFEASLAYGIWSSVLTDSEYVGQSAGGAFAKIKSPELEPIRAAIRTELAPWALGYSDPVRQRVEGRKREAARE